ncbi:MAG TPA: 16S rRNA (cytidine(1402)-2'-O)-methyltransferase [Candidatus Gracilibacteria bacterium]
MPELYIVATPIGNLSDMTFRAVETLKSVDFIVAEDTRHAGILLKKYEIQTALLSFHAQSSDRKAEEIIKRIKKGETAAYISDAGTPCISDPGYKLTSLAAQANIPISPIPGPCALTTLISACGMPADQFVFHGFLPHKKGRQTLLTSMKESKMPHIFYESVHRFGKLLEQLKELVGAERTICVGRELTKIHEEIFRGSVQQAQDHFDKENTRGEFVVMVMPKK